MRFKGRFNQKYKEDPNSFGRQPMPAVERAMQYIQSGKALDLGVGNGRHTLFLVSKGFEVTGVDMSQEGLNIVKKRTKDPSKVKLIKQDVTKFKTNEKFDLVLAIGLLHFLEKDQILKLLENIKSFTKPSGLNVIAARLTQNLRNDLPYVFKHNELKSYYKDWSILEYKEKKRRRGEVASIIAKNSRE